jgi:hypothetical protein
MVRRPERLKTFALMMKESLLFLRVTFNLGRLGGWRTLAVALTSEMEMVVVRRKPSR